MKIKAKRKSKNYWVIDDEGGASLSKFESLSAAKQHFAFYSAKESKELKGVAIYHVKDDNIISSCTYIGRKGSFDKFTRIRRFNL